MSQVRDKEHLRRYYRWKEHPVVDEKTKKKLEEMEGEEEKIKELFSGNLEFGTGGMRGIIGPGSSRFNRYVVRRATQGIANYLQDNYPEKEKKVALAYDPRYLSADTAEEAALVLCANGIKSLLFDDIRPTPVLSFAIRYLECVGGIVITASHNPPEYNGFKVYTEDGGQCVPSVTETLVQYIEKIDIFDDVHTMTRENARSKGLLYFIGEEVDRAYLNKVKSLCTFQGEKEMHLVYTPLHGTGYPFVPRVLKELGYSGVHLVEEQLVPDPEFSTVKSPNPEEREAFSRALKLAKQVEAELVLATDPDCDRVGCGVRNKSGEYTLLSGNQIGALLLNYLLERNYRAGTLPPDGVMIKTIVTGDLGKKIAEDYGIRTEETLTGFKFIGEKIREYEKQGDHQFIFGYEESYGYLAGTFARDKDGVVTSALLVDMASYYREQGITLLEQLDNLYIRYGYYREELDTFKLENTGVVDRILQGLKQEMPSTIGEQQVSEIKDYQEGLAICPVTNRERELGLPRTSALFFQLKDESWACIRPSGTEPKMKIYYSSTGKTGKDAQKKLDSMKEDLGRRIQNYKK